MDEFTLKVIDVAGETIRLDVRLRSGAVDLCSGSRRLGAFVRDDLFKWLQSPSGQISDRDVSWKSMADEVVLDIGIMFVSQIVLRHDLELLKAHISLAIDRSAIAGVSSSASRHVRAESSLRRVLMEVVTGSGRAAPVEFRIGGSVVEVWFRQMRSGIFDREILRGWLAQPGRPLVQSSTAFSLDRVDAREAGVSISLPDVLVWRLAPIALKQLRDEL